MGVADFNPAFYKSALLLGVCQKEFCSGFIPVLYGFCNVFWNPTWRFMGSYEWGYKSLNMVISKVTIVITHIRGLITPFRNYP